MNQSLWWGKLGRQGDICWLKKELVMVHGTLDILLGIKLFCLSREKSEIFSISLISFSWNLTKFQHFRTTLMYSRKKMSPQCLSEWAEILQGFTKSWIKQLLKISAFYPDKQKSFIPKKIWSVPWIVLSSANRCRIVY